jgi:hypothetical protein
MQWPAILARRDLGVGLFCPRQRLFARERDDAAKVRVEPIDPRQVNPGEAFRRQLPLLNPP